MPSITSPDAWESAYGWKRWLCTDEGGGSAWLSTDEDDALEELVEIETKVAGGHTPREGRISPGSKKSSDSLTNTSTRRSTGTIVTFSSVYTPYV